MPNHYEDGTHIWNGYGGETTVFDCGCGLCFTETAELLAHIMSMNELEEYADVL